MFVAVKTGAPERVHPLFSLTLGLLFMSSMAMPRDLIQEDWFKTIATYNPMSYPIEAARSLFISGLGRRGAGARRRDRRRPLDRWSDRLGRSLRRRTAA